jgi:2-methylcitrate dehydratase PrpD
MITKEFGEFISNRPRDWSAEATRQASRAFVDTIACMIAGRKDAAVLRASQTFRQWSNSTDGTPCVTGQRLPAPWAALVNGAAAHALDYDDVSEPALTHPSAALVPALLALALERKCSGEQIIDAYIIGFEIQAALGAAMNDAHYGRGWHTT